MTMKFALALLFSLPLQSASFSPAARLPLSTHEVPSSLIGHRATAAVRGPSSWSSALMAKKRRRRKETAPAPTSQSNELPDFVDGEADPTETKSATTIQPIDPTIASTTSLKTSPSAKATPVMRGDGLSATLAEEVGGNVQGLAEDTILEAMRGKASSGAWQPPRSIEDTLTDRSLEKLMDFDKMIEQDGNTEETLELPDFDEVISRRKQREASVAMKEGRVEDVAMLIDSSSMGKKAARNAERKALALQREAEIEAEKSPFEDTLKDLNMVKVLENGAWVGIGLLVVWEVYINSPLFERVAPVIPVVY